MNNIMFFLLHFFHELLKAMDMVAEMIKDFVFNAAEVITQLGVCFMVSESGRFAVDARLKRTKNWCFVGEGIIEKINSSIRRRSRYSALSSLDRASPRSRHATRAAFSLAPQEPLTLISYFFSSSILLNTIASSTNASWLSSLRFFKAHFDVSRRLSKTTLVLRIDMTMWAFPGWLRCPSGASRTSFVTSDNSWNAFKRLLRNLLRNS
ncbi:hypothetical protein BD779DRAFT_1509761 [Infundibulicybe gibba]|nr:hypothetical protein BD779DRAFT_1509761 [Infundibulicybe gibba]